MQCSILASTGAGILRVFSGPAEFLTSGAIIQGVTLSYNSISRILLLSNEDKNIQIRVKLAYGNVCLYGSCDSVVMACLMCYLEPEYLVETTSDSQLILLQNTRILRNNTTFAEVRSSRESAALLFHIWSQA